MNTKVCRFFALMLVIALVAIPGLALADPPVQGRWVSEGVTELPCEAFVANVTYSEVGHWVIYAWDELGNPVAWRINFSGDYTYTNPNNGKYLLGHSAGSTIVDLPNATVANIGLIGYVRLPHGGVVHIEMGQVVYNPFTMELIHDAGQNNFPYGAQAVICELLADQPRR